MRLSRFIPPALLLFPFAALAQPRPFGAVTLQQLIGNIVRGIVGFMGSISLLMFVYGGFLWMTAQGSEEKVKKARSTITYSTLGIIMAFLSYAIVASVLRTIGSVGNGT